MYSYENAVDMLHTLKKKRRKTLERDKGNTLDKNTRNTHEKKTRNTQDTQYTAQCEMHVHGSSTHF